MKSMRAKMRITDVKVNGENNETLRFSAVGRNDAYPDDGSDENNTYAKFSPSGSLELTVANPALIGKFAVGEEYYLDFTLASAGEQPGRVAGVDEPTAKE